MKKFMALLCAGILTCSMGMVAFAAESPSTPAATPSQEEVIQQQSHSTVDSVRIWDKIVVDGKEVEGGISVAPVKETVKAAAEAQAKAVVNNGTVLQVVEVSFPDSFSKITVPFNLTNVKAGDSIVVLHQKKDGTWETITPDKVEDGKVTVTFTSLSPVAFVTGSAAGGVKSPKTNDAAVPFVAVMAVVAIAGAAVAGKKAFN